MVDITKIGERKKGLLKRRSCVKIAKLLKAVDLPTEIGIKDELQGAKG